MKIFKSWEEYYQSEQDFYLDEENLAHEDTKINAGVMTIYGKSDIESYYIMREGIYLVAVCVGSADEAVIYANAERDYEAAYSNGDAYHFLMENADSLDLDEEAFAAARAYMCFDWSVLSDDFAEIADALGLSFLRDEESGEYEDNPLETPEAVAAIGKYRGEIIAVYRQFLKRW